MVQPLLRSHTVPSVFRFSVLARQSFISSLVLSALFIFLILPPARAAEVFDHSKWDHLLKQYVHNGRVDYEGLLQSKGELDDYLSQMEAVSVEALSEYSREERIAFWINLYNASVIRMVLDEYPVERFDQIPGAFEIRTVRIIGEFFSLSELRDQVLRKGFRDERILMALVSARADSPRLLPEAFRGDRLDEQLNKAAHDFVEDEAKNQVRPGEKKVFLSPLFHDFGSDFLLNFGSEKASSRFSQIETAVISFILRHLSNPDKRIFLDSGRYKIRYLPEDPSLNRVTGNSKG